MNTHLSENHLPRELSPNWMLWLALRHFLPAVAQRELAKLALRELTAGRIELHQLIEELPIPQPQWNEAWLFRERLVEDKISQFAQSVVTAIAWQNDGAIWRAAPEDDAANNHGVTASVLALLLRLGAVDFAWPLHAFERLEELRGVAQEGPSLFLDALSVARERAYTEDSEALWRDIDGATAPLALPLRFVVTKHLGDLCAGVDRWNSARAGYQLAFTILQEWKDSSSALCSLTAPSWRSIIRQSIASADRVLLGAKVVASTYRGLADAPLAESAIQGANVALDNFAIATHPAVDRFNAHDSRVREMRSPLRLDSLPSEHAMRHMLNGNYDAASRQWSSLLRRQLALGGEYEARSTMAFYARTIVEDLQASLSKELQPDEFAYAVRLLVESGRIPSVSSIGWSNELVDAYVTKSVVDDVIERTQAFPGVVDERRLVAIHLFEEWGRRLSPDFSALGKQMMAALCVMAYEGKVACEKLEDIGRSALEALAELARYRPEWRGAVSDRVTQALLCKLNPEESWWAHSAALEVAREYVDAMTGPNAVAVVDATLRLLASLRPEDDMFPSVRPALNFLVSSDAKKHFIGDQARSREVLEAVLRFGATQDSEKARLLFYLHDFDRALLSDPNVGKQIAPALEETRRSALETNSSNVCDGIDALLIAPILSGRDGLKAGLEGLVRVLMTAPSRRPSPGLAFAYGPILDLCAHAPQIEKELGDADAWRGWLEKITMGVEAVWERAVTHPLVFAPMSIPPRTKVEPVIVHNWAFATARFGETFQVGARVTHALDRLPPDGELANLVRLARGTRAMSSERMNGIAEAIGMVRASGREGFYMSLSRWLVLLEKRSVGEDAVKLCGALLEQVLQFGPRALDASVLLASARLGLQTSAFRPRIEEYSARIHANRELRFALEPLADLLATKIANEPDS